MKRDFTIECYEEFCALIQQIKDDDWCGITDWFGDIYLDVKHWLYDQGVGSYTDNMEQYYRELLDRKNTSVTKVKQVFEDISTLDSSYSADSPGRFGICKSQVEAYRDYLESLTQITTASCNAVAEGKKLTDVFNRQNIRDIMKTVSDQLNVKLTNILFNASTFKNISEEYKQEYIDNYELNYPDQAKKINGVLCDPDLTEQEKKDIKFLIYTAPEPYRTIYLEHLDKYDVVVFQKGSKDSDGCEGSCYSSSSGKIYLKDSDDTFGRNPRGPYNTFFHESAHAMDDYEKKSDFLSRNYTYNGKSLQDCIEDDARNYVSDIIDREYPNMPPKQKQQLLKSLNLTEDADFDYGGDTAGLDPAVKEYRNNIVSIMENDLYGETNEAASDVYGGVTNNAVNGSYGHRKDANDKTYTYWYNGDKPTKKQASELWAEFYAAQMTHDTESLASIKAHFPEAYKAMEAMAKDMANS